MVRGNPAEQERTVARALAAGINYFDTAVQYGNGASETNLGCVWAKLRPNASVGTKVRLTQTERADYRRRRSALVGRQPETAGHGLRRHLASTQRDHPGRHR